MKQLLASTPVLRYYDGQKDLEIQCDACDKGLRAALMQEGQPIAFGSRALTEVEGRYAPIEKVEKVERYHQYTFGNRTTVYSDHRTLQNIMEKPLKQVPRRLQRLRMCLQNYDVHIVYQPGPQQLIVDQLSRSPQFYTDTGGRTKDEPVVSLILLEQDSTKDSLVDGARQTCRRPGHCYNRKGSGCADLTGKI